MPHKATSSIQRRISLVSLLFLAGFCVLALRMIMLAATTVDTPPPRANVQTSGMHGVRANIVDRMNRVLATNVTAGAVYVHPQELDEPLRQARELARIFPEQNAGELYTKFISGRKFVWIARPVTPRQMEEVYALGGSGIYIGTHPRRLYPAYAATSHVMGGVRYGVSTVHSAELVGVAGIEYSLNDRLSDSREPLQLSIDMRVQAAMRDVLHTEGLGTYTAKGGAGVIMDVHTGEVLSLVSVPDFDVNNRPKRDLSIPASDNLTFNRAIQGLYELGSVYKVVAAALAMERGIVTPDQMVDPRKSFYIGRNRIKDDHPIREVVPFRTAMAKSSNIVISKLMLEVGRDDFKDFLRRLHLFDALDIQLSEAQGTKPLVAERWGDIHVATASYGHGFSSTVMHLAKAYASIVNGGTLVKPTLLYHDPEVPIVPGPRIISEETSAHVRDILAEVVTKGTGRRAQVEGYAIGGKTGTADKPRLGGRGYHRDKVISTFAAAFPIDNPKYVVVVSLDEPTHYINGSPFRSAGFTAAPTAGKIIERAGPLLGIQPVFTGEEDEAP